MADRPPVTVELVWSDGLRFGATAGSNAVVVDGDSVAGLSPPQLLAVSLASCMAIDIVLILQKGRHSLSAFRTSIVAERLQEFPRRFVRVTLQFHLNTDASSDVLERAIALSREKYCSVWHSMRQDIDLVTTFEIHP